LPKYKVSGFRKCLSSNELALLVRYVKTGGKGSIQWWGWKTALREINRRSYADGGEAQV